MHQNNESMCVSMSHGACVCMCVHTHVCVCVHARMHMYGAHCKSITAKEKKDKLHKKSYLLFPMKKRKANQNHSSGN